MSKTTTEGNPAPAEGTEEADGTDGTAEAERTEETVPAAGAALRPQSAAPTGLGAAAWPADVEAADLEAASVEAADGDGQAGSIDNDQAPIDQAPIDQAPIDQAPIDQAASDQAASDRAPVSGEALLVQEGEIAGDYLEQLLDILDYDGDIDLDVEGSRAVVAIVGANDLDPLVGSRGVTLDALQELTRLTVAQQTGVRTRLMLDVGGYRAGRRTELSELAAVSVTRVIDSGETVRMSPMNAFERKIVHDVVTATDGVRSESEGEDPDRRVVILPDR